MKNFNLFFLLSILLVAFLNHYCERDDRNDIIQLEHLYGRWEMVSQSHVDFVDGKEDDRGSILFVPNELIMELDTSGYCIFYEDGELESISTFTVTESNIELFDPEDWETITLNIKTLTSSKLIFVIEEEETEDGITYLYKETSEFRKISGSSGFAIPNVTTVEVTDISYTSARSGGIASGGLTDDLCIAGVCWSKTSEPIIDPEDIYYPENIYFTVDTFEIGNYTSIISELVNNTTYYIRAYIITDYGIFYGNILSFKTLDYPVPDFSGNIGTFFDTRDGQEYNWVRIGNQIWMAENLNIGQQIICYDDQSNNQIFEKYCYNNDKSNCDTYGGLYQWNEMMQYTQIESTQGICPTGWHIPSDEELKEMEMALGMSQVEADKWAQWRGTDQGTQIKLGGSSGFEALMAGRRSGSMYDFNDLGITGYFHSSSHGIEYTSNAISRSVKPAQSGIWREEGRSGNGYSVRCVKDK